MASSADLFDTNTASPSDVAGSNSASAMPTYSGKMPDYSIWGDIANFFSGNRAKREADYQQWLDNTAVQRRMWDLKQSGINPVLAGLGSGAMNTAYGNGSAAGSHSAAKTYQSGARGLASQAMTAFALIKIAALLGFL